MLKPTLKGADEPAGYEYQIFDFEPWVDKIDASNSFPVLAAVGAGAAGDEPNPAQLEVQVFHSDIELLDVASEATFELYDWASDNCPSRLTGTFSNPIALPLAPAVE